MADDQDQDIFGENQQTSPQPVEDKLFGEDNTTEISLDSDKKEEESLPESRPVLVTESDPPTHEEKQEEPENTSSRTNEEIEEEESGDTFDINIKISDPIKIGDGMSAYMSYLVTTQTSMPSFKSSEFSVKRRFSDFLGLSERLNEKHLLLGRIVPPPPDKSVVGMVKVKGSKENQSSTDFVEKRKHALEKYVNRLARHKDLCEDSDFKEFLEADELPRAKNTSALSKGGLSRLAKGIGEAMSKMTSKIVETDSWFEEKQNQVEALDNQLKKLHTATEMLVTLRKEVSVNTAAFAKSCSLLSSAEEHSGLSKALTQLAEVEEKIEHIQGEQSATDFFGLSECLKEYIGMLAAVKAVFNQRNKVWGNWQSAQTTLNKKREALAKFEIAGKADKVGPAQEEVKEWERRVEKGEEDFDSISKSIKIEMARFETMRIKDFKELIITYLESLLDVQQQFVTLWEGFGPVAKEIC
ncbi:sorting nexin-2-like [Hydractinia symbiolongicarpus]|uniref:sorting nexin-2-like n=1 Tax=Hydractinia symbiolongicarpus TaxID=13093 RepID=UPI0025507266|nr:sorting nexin-2-like [Hydractinia symbiolongicarpus]